MKSENNIEETIVTIKCDTERLRNECDIRLKKYKLLKMKKSFILWMFAMLMLAVGMSSCSSDDEGSGLVVDPSIKINELLIFSKDKSSVEIAQTHVPNYGDPLCHKIYYRDPYHDEDPRKICLLQFSCKIAGSKITDMLDVQLQSYSSLDFERLKVGDSFECSTSDEVTDEVGLGAAVSVVRTDGHKVLQLVQAQSGRITVVDNKPIDGKPAITLKIEDLSFSTCTLSGTIQFEVRDIIQETINNYYSIN